MRITLIVVTLLVAFLCAGCKTNPATGKSQFIVVSPEETAQMGEQAKPELTKEYGGEVKSAELRAYVEQVGKRLARHTESEYKDTKWEFTTLDSDVINAFALPGGKVFMSRGLLEQLNSEAAWRACWGTRSATSPAGTSTSASVTRWWRRVWAAWHRQRPAAPEAGQR
jgi:predicted Zn-dependent protease